MTFTILGLIVLGAAAFVLADIGATLAWAALLDLWRDR